MTTARLGAYTFANSAPVTTALNRDEVRLPIGVEMVESVPAVLNNSVLFGEVDVTPVSASHYVGREDRLVEVPDLAITSEGPVQSVLFLHDRPIEKLDGCTVGITQQSSTARTMLQILMARHWRIEPKVNIGPCYPSDVGDRYEAALVIGDDALAAFADPPNDLGVVDLGEAWHDLTGGPAIWALWVARREFADDDLCDEIASVLADARAWGRDHWEDVVAEAAGSTGLDRELVADYLDGLGYTLDDRARKALETLQTYKAELA